AMAQPIPPRGFAGIDARSRRPDAIFELPGAVRKRRWTVEPKATARQRGQRGGGGSSPSKPGAAPVLTELKGVDSAYPLYGTLALHHGPYAHRLPLDCILIGDALADKLGLRPGDRLRYGATTFTVADVIADEPDRLGEGFTLGPVALVTMEGLRSTGLIQPGSLFESKYRIRLPAGADARATRATLQKRYASTGWQIRDRDRAAAGAERFFENMGQFLALIGLAALIIAGIGVSNGVSSYLSMKRSGIATLKVLGGTSRDIERIYLLQIGCVALLAVGAGLVVGAVAPPILIALAGDMLPIRPGFHVHPVPLATSAAYGALIALIFTLPPLERARTQPAAVIFRSLIDPRRTV